MARRSRAREVTLQLLFQWDQNPVAVPRRAVERFARERLLGDAEMVSYCLSLMDGVIANKERIDPLITAAAENWRLSRMMPADRNVLRLGTYELMFDPDKQPLEVIISEAIDLSRRFGSADSPKFVNGVLDKIAGPRKPKATVQDEAPPKTDEISPVS